MKLALLRYAIAGRMNLLVSGVRRRRTAALSFGAMLLALAVTAPAQAQHQPGNCVGCDSYGPAVMGAVGSTPGGTYMNPGRPTPAGPSTPRPQISDPSDSGAPVPPGDLSVSPSDLSDMPAPMADTGDFNASASVDNFVRQSGVASESQSLTPNMVGDMAVAGSRLFLSSSGIEAGGIGSFYRRFKIADNNSPLVRHRAYLTYNHFHNTFSDVGGGQYNTDRYTVGIERPFWDGNRSIEVRVPLVSSIDNNVEVASINSTSGNDQQLGNITLAYKQYLYRTSNSALTAGLGLGIPTAPGETYTEVVANFRVKNEAWHLQPFIGYTENVTDRIFVTGFAQVDFDLNGNGIENNGVANLVGERSQDQNLLMLDVQVGSWLYRNPCARVTGVAALLELHYNTALQDSDDIDAGGGGAIYGTPYNRFDVLNLTAALHFQLGSSTTLRTGVAVPLRQEDRNFDTELMVQFNHYFR
ncbi:hypothetical protein [Lignipirellula cremea]|uniref:Uncharacterized protein n=1 Tax=Lignipirellula cremea TaxID=2528010 RepID=A0A518DWU5_9BACT|nr:hypothetical protein [Lignipirellula cremea]QDU96307.1 hypothetical protein Pla8534_41270 [Lignipirellula cremea]